MQTTSQESYQQVFQVANQLFSKDPDWVTFFREVLGIDGVVRQTFPSFDQLTAFERSEEFDQIQKMLVKLREKKATAETDTEPTRVITVRLPKSMHEYLRNEAHDLHTSMNKLCISKLLQMIEQDMIPAEQVGPPKRRNTPAPATEAAQPAPAHTPPAHSGQTLAASTSPLSTASSNGHTPFKGGF